MSILSQHLSEQDKVDNIGFEASKNKALQNITVSLKMVENEIILVKKQYGKEKDPTILNHLAAELVISIKKQFVLQTHYVKILSKKEKRKVPRV